MNRERLQLVIDYIKLFPETYDQKVMHAACGAKHCIAGHAELMFWKEDCLRLNMPESEQEDCFPCTWDRAKFCLDLSDREALYLFASCRSFNQIEEFAKASISQYGKRYLIIL